MYACGGAAATATATLLRNNPSIVSLDFGESVEKFDILPWDGTSGERDAESPWDNHHPATQHGIRGLLNLPVRQLKSFQMRAAAPHPQLLETVKLLMQDDCFHNLEFLKFSITCGINPKTLDEARDCVLPNLKTLCFAHTAESELSSYAEIYIAPSLEIIEIYYSRESNSAEQNPAAFLAKVSAELAKNPHVGNKAVELQAIGHDDTHYPGDHTRLLCSLRHEPGEGAAT